MALLLWHIKKCIDNIRKQHGILLKEDRYKEC